MKTPSPIMMYVILMVILALGLFILSGCAGTIGAVYSNLPSVQNCHTVTYERTHNSEIHIEAFCTAPVKFDPLLDIPTLP
jgi:hypothetical protein